VEQYRWPEGFNCHKCGHHAAYVYFRHAVKVFQCQSCRAQTTLTEGTIFHSTKLSLKIWFQSIFFVTQNKNHISALELKRHLGVCYRTAWRVKQKLMPVMDERERTTVLSGRVEIDDAYRGGENPGGKAGCGSENKSPFIAAILANTSTASTAALIWRRCSNALARHRRKQERDLKYGSDWHLRKISAH